MPLILQSQYQIPFNHLVAVMHQVRQNSRNPDTQKMRAKVVGSRVWLEAELVKAKRLWQEERDANDKARYATKIEKITELLNKTDCDIRVESPAGVIDKAAFAEAYDEYQRALVPGIPFDKPREASFYQPQLPAYFPRDFDLSFQNKLVQPRSNFDAYIDERNEMIFTSAEHKRDFEDFIHRDTIKTYHILEQVQKQDYVFLEASNFANLLKSYGKPIRMGKHFDLETAQALDLLLNDAAYYSRREMVKSHVGRIYVKGFKRGDRAFFPARDAFFKEMVDEINVQVQKDLNAHALIKSDELLKFLRGLKNSLRADSDTDCDETADWLGQLNMAEQKRIAFEKNMGAATVQEIEKFNAELQNIKNEGMKIYVDIERRNSVVVREVAEERIKKLSEKQDHAPQPHEKHKNPKKNKKKKSHASKPAENEDDFDAILKRQNEENEAIRKEKETTENTLFAAQEEMLNEFLSNEMGGWTIDATQLEKDLACVATVIESLNSSDKFDTDEHLLESVRQKIATRTSREIKHAAQIVASFEALVSDGIGVDLISKLKMIHALLIASFKGKIDGSFETLCFNLPTSASVFDPRSQDGPAIMRQHLKAWSETLERLYQESGDARIKANIDDIDLFLKILDGNYSVDIDSVNEETVHFNRMIADKQYETVSSRQDSFHILKGMLAAFKAAIKHSNESGEDALNCLQSDFNRGLARVFAPNRSNENDRLALMQDFLIDWIKYFEEATDIRSPALTLSVGLAKRFKSSLDTIFPGSRLEGHPLFIFYEKNHDFLRLNLLQESHDLNDTFQLKLFTAIYKKLKDQLNSGQRVLLMSLVSSRLEDKHLLTAHEFSHIQYKLIVKLKNGFFDEKMIPVMMTRPGFNELSGDSTAMIKLRDVFNVLNLFVEHVEQNRSTLYNDYFERLADIFSPVEHLHLGRLLQMEKYLELVRNYLLEQSARLPSGLSEAFDFVSTIRAELKKIFPNDMPNHKLYAFYFDHAEELKAFSEKEISDYLNHPLSREYADIQNEIIALHPSEDTRRRLQVLVSFCLVDSKKYTAESLIKVISLNRVPIESAQTACSELIMPELPIKTNESNNLTVKFEELFDKYFILLKKNCTAVVTKSWAAVRHKFDQEFFTYAYSNGAAPCEASEAYHASFMNMYALYADLNDMVDLYNATSREKFKATSYQELVQFGDSADEITDSAYFIYFSKMLLEKVPKRDNTPFYIDWDLQAFKDSPKLKLATFYKLVQAQFRAGLRVNAINSTALGSDKNVPDAELVLKHDNQLNRLLTMSRSLNGVMMLRDILQEGSEHPQSTQKTVLHAKNKGKAQAQSVTSIHSGATDDELRLFSEISARL